MKVVPIHPNSKIKRSYKYESNLVDANGLPIRQLDLFNPVLNANRETYFKNFVCQRRKKSS